MISITNPPLRKAALAFARCSAALTSNGLAQSPSHGLARSLPASRLPQDVLKVNSVSAHKATN